MRTGDTPQEERRLMMTRPPHILMTTPESLALMLAMESYRKHLSSIETVIVDEIHALAANKRGSYLALCLEALELITKAPPLRVGLSATVAPLEEVARFLVGTGRDCAIVDKRGLRAIRLGITAPFTGAMAPMSTIAKAAVELGRDVRTQLVFTNVRSQAERLAHEMASLEAQEGENVELIGEDAKARPRSDSKIGIHHSALERSVRHRVEARLRDGSLHTVVCSSSLELGVDIGHIDRVCIFGGARGVTATLQRVGRAGHRPDAVADGVVIAQDRDDILEAAATRRCIHDGMIEESVMPSAPLDVLAQWLVLMVCPERTLALDDALAIGRRAAPYADLREDDLRSCVAYLSGGGVGPDEAHVRRLGFDGVSLHGLGREVSAAFFENVGTIPDESGILVSAHGAKIGKVEEDFVSSLRLGDVFLLSGTAYKVREIRGSGIAVEHVNARPNVPQWSSHIKGVPVVLGREIAALRFGIGERLERGGPQAAFAWLSQRYGLEGTEAAHAVRYIAQQQAVSLVAAPREAFIEIYRMDRNQTAIVHTCAGRRANETIARIVAARLLREHKLDSHLTTDDNGFLVSLPAGRTLPDALWASLLHTRNFERDLHSGLRASHLLRRHFRYVANTGLLVLRRAAGRQLRRSALRWNSERIFDRLYAA
ncbi:MAG TPA: DEAD/DEAH box helicase, partial [Candidatus Baltobacteraceae bacterium]